VSHSYRELIAWQVAKKLAVTTYKVTESFPKSETYGLTSQIRRAAVSVVSNIAEGQGRLTKGEFQQFLGHARGSLLELETQFSIALDLAYVSQAQFQEVETLIRRTLALLTRLIESLHAGPRAQARTPSRFERETRNTKRET
jgi:four helix bundle protein